MVEAAARRAHLENVRGTNSAIYSSKIIKAGALIADTKTLLLTHWNTAESNRANLDPICLENVFGEASRSRVKDVLSDLPSTFSFRSECDEGAARACSEASPCPARSIACSIFTRRGLSPTPT